MALDRMSKQKNPRGLFCEVNREADGRQVFNSDKSKFLGRAFEACSRLCSVV